MNPKTKLWEPARVIKQCETPRSYIVEIDTGAVYNRNRSHMNKTQEQFQFDAPPRPPDDLAETLETSKLPSPTATPPKSPVVNVSKKLGPKAKLVEPVRRSGRLTKKRDILDL